MTATHAGAPWASALGPRLEQLPPSLAAYFGPIPPGSRGVGEGVFRVVGSPRRGLRPFLAILGRWGVAWPVWEHEVPFTVVNAPTSRGLLGLREFRFRSGSRVMRDRIVWTRHGLRQHLGSREQIVVELRVELAEGGLRISSGRVGIALGRLRVSLPERWAPRVTVQERVGADGRQHVALALDLPLLGRAYEFDGMFSHRIEPAPGAWQ